MFTYLIIFVIALLTALTIHEAAHAYASNYLGDPTARLMGRLTLNPLAHLDPMGTAVFILTALAGFPIGWGKPVVFDPYNLKNPKKDAAIISLAGPASNLLLASLASLIFRLHPNMFFETLTIINISLAIFNLIPIHPLDGGKILVALLPPHEARTYDLFLNKYGTLILLILILPIASGHSIVSMVISPIIDFLIKALLPGSGLV